MEELHKFVVAQVHAIEKSVYIESEKANKNLRYDSSGNPSDEFIVCWIEQHAGKFREAWEKSDCQFCKKVFECYDCLKTNCSYIEK